MVCASLMEDKRQIGFQKEKVAVEFLKKNGYKIIETNFKANCGEIDIIAKDKLGLSFIEVKYRKNLNYVSPIEAVTLKKQQKIIKTAIKYLSQNKIKSEFRFDIVSITEKETQKIKAALTSPAGKYYL
ncbi:MAG: YraN family protein [Elusimicrobiota bacterium]|nr:YraN family protein [Elusimicrobiota bacterium]